MEFKDGVQLKKVWNELSENNKLDITNQLRDIFTQVRKIPSPGRFSNVTGGPLRHSYFWSLTPNPEINGPSTKEEDLSMAVAKRSQGIWDGHGQRSWISEFFARNLPSDLSGHASVFTHANVQRKNILVEKISPQETEGDEERSQWRVSAVVDWEDSGWYPSY